MGDFLVINFGGYAAIRAVSERAKKHLAERNAASTPEKRAVGLAGPTIMTGEKAHLSLADLYRQRGFVVEERERCPT